jgi:hypothetical protein
MPAAKGDGSDEDPYSNPLRFGVMNNWGPRRRPGAL